MPKYGWLPDIPDKRDFPFKLVAPVKVAVPKAYDLRWNCSVVENQAEIGSCTGNAAAGDLEYKDNKNDKKYLEVSRLFIYYNGRSYIDCIDQDSGAYIRDVIKGLAEFGACDEQFWPYDTKKFSDKPPKKAYTDALKRKIHSYYRIKEDRVNACKQAIYAGHPVIFGFTVYSGFESPEVSKTGKMWLPKPDESMVGGHAVLMVGYNDEIGCFIVRNSWGEEWGDKGYFYMPYEYVADDELSDDYWVIMDEQEFTAISQGDFHISPDMEVESDWYIPITTIVKVVWAAITWWRKTPKP
jgi:C1A family cysteine protease